MTKHPLVGCPVFLNRTDVTIGEVRETGDGILFTIRWDSQPVLRDGKLLGMTPVRTTWMRCTERDSDTVAMLLGKWVDEYGLYDDPRISDTEPPVDVVCGGWLAPSGELWRSSDVAHQFVAARIVRQLHLPIGDEDPKEWLPAHGWLVIYESGWVYGTIPEMTQAQRDALFDLAMRFPTMRPQLMAALKFWGGDVIENRLAKCGHCGGTGTKDCTHASSGGDPKKCTQCFGTGKRQCDWCKGSGKRVGGY